MPLPQALAERLAKRGIIKIKVSQKESEQESAPPLHEEIIAEDYDETPQDEAKEVKEEPEFEKFQGWNYCPNKWNVYHECSSKCKELWANVKELDKDYIRKRLKMLQKFPLLDHWKEILDTGIGRYYYWNTETNLVSWLPPGHPKCQVSLAAAELRKNMVQEREERMKEEEILDGIESEDEASSDEENNVEENPKKKNLSDGQEGTNSSGESSDEAQKEKKTEQKERVKEKERDRAHREREKDRKSKDRRRKRKDKSDALDPMDPAAYSECPRGTWASGLPERNEARTGVDPTATGPLFQMRPYPNPGAVLRANAAVNNTVGPKKPS